MKVINKTWKREYTPIEEFEAGIVLNGPETKSAVEGRIKLEASYVKISDNEFYLVNTEIFRYKYDGNRDYNSTRRRKLLLNRREILRIQSRMASSPSLTIVPTSMYTKGRRVKVAIALVKGKNETQKRRLEKGKILLRSQQREVKEYMKK